MLHARQLGSSGVICRRPRARLLNDLTRGLTSSPHRWSRLAAEREDEARSSAVSVCAVARVPHGRGAAVPPSSWFAIRGDGSAKRDSETKKRGVGRWLSLAWLVADREAYREPQVQRANAWPCAWQSGFPVARYPRSGFTFSVVTPLACVCLADKPVSVFRPTRRRCPRLGFVVRSRAAMLRQ